MKYNGFMPDDFLNGEGVCVSLWVSGCPLHCKGCHNPETWDPDRGAEIPENLIEKLKAAITKNGIKRNFSILGGEPLASYNINFVNKIIAEIRNAFPDIKIFLWTGYTIEELDSNAEFIDNPVKKNILNNIDVLIDGPFIEEQKDITLKLRGSKNQRILYKGKDF